MLLLAALASSPEAAEQGERERIELWRLRLVALEASETALEGRMLEAAAHLDLASRSLDLDVQALDIWRDEQQATAEFCQLATQLTGEGVRFARAAMGAGFGVAQQLETARQFGCASEADHRGFLAALQNANRMSADSLRLLHEAGQRRQGVMAAIAHLRDKGLPVAQLTRAFDRSAWADLWRARIAPALQAARAVLDERAALAAEAETLQGQRRALHDVLKAEAQAGGSDPLWRLAERVAEPRPWTVTAARVERERAELEAGDQAIRGKLAALGDARVPEDCGSLAAVEQSFADAEYIARYSVLQVYALDALQRQCAASLPGGEKLLPPADGAILVQVDGIDCDGPLNRPGEPERVVCDVRWTLTNTGAAALIWTAGAHAWRSGDRAENGGLAYDRRVIGPGESERHRLRCLAFGPPYQGRWHGRGRALDPKTGTSHQWEIAGDCRE